MKFSCSLKIYFALSRKRQIEWDTSNIYHQYHQARTNLHPFAPRVARVLSPRKGTAREWDRICAAPPQGTPRGESPLSRSALRRVSSPFSRGAAKKEDGKFNLRFFSVELQQFVCTDVEKYAKNTDGMIVGKPPRMQPAADRRLGDSRLFRQRRLRDPVLRKQILQ